MTSSRTPLIAGNWKMNLNHLEAIALTQQLSYELANHDYDAVEVSIHPPFTALRSLQTVIDVDRLGFKLGAQNCHTEPSGAHTGEVSPSMLASLDVSYVIVGHSERRADAGETNELVAAKAKAVFAAQMTPIVCVGESLDVRTAGDAQDVVAAQLSASLAGLTKAQRQSVVVAYEPIWAIGTGRTATPKDAESMCAALRATLGETSGSAAQSVRVLYGGSVKPVNAAELLAQPSIDGALVGGASLDAVSFGRITKAAGAQLAAS